MALYSSVKDTLAGLQAKPQDEELQSKIEEAFVNHRDVVFDVLREEANKTIPTTDPPVDLARPSLTSRIMMEDPDWVNTVGEQRCTPLSKVKPKSLKHLVEIVAKAKDLKQRVRAVGSGHAFSDVARTDGAILINPVLLNDVADVDTTSLRELARDMKLVRVQAGITVRNFKAELDNRGLALINMGGYDGQTISGTVSTGTLSGF
jgi:L-gulono-1,4-lactone dehydrogenase